MRNIPFLLCFLFFCGTCLAVVPQSNTTDEVRVVLRPVKLLELPISPESRKNVQLPVSMGKGANALFPASVFEIYGRNTQSSNAEFAVRATGVKPEYLRGALTKAGEKWHETMQPDGNILFLFPNGDNNYSVSVHQKTDVFLLTHINLKQSTPSLFKDFLDGGMFPQNAAVAGSIRLPQNYRHAHPLLKDVETIDFYIAPGKNHAGESRVTGKVSFYSSSTTANQRIFKDTMQFFSEIYANAATKGQLRADHMEAFRVILENGKTTVVLSLSQQIAEDFIIILSAQIRGVQCTEQERTLL